MKKMLKGLLIVLVALFIVTGCGKEVKDDDRKDLDPDSAVLGEQTIEGLKIGQMSIVYEDNISRLVTNVENTNATDFELRIIGIKLYDDEDNLLLETSGYIGSKIKANETKQLVAEATKDLRKATKVEYTIEK
jgi:Flp pilus assembly pilin Flp